MLRKSFLNAGPNERGFAIVRHGRLPYGAGPQASRDDFHSRRAAHAKLMNSAASPGRTWLIFVVERQLPPLAGAPSAAVPGGGFGIARLSDMGGTHPSAQIPDLGRQGYPHSEFGSEFHRNRRLDCAPDPLPLK